MKFDPKLRKRNWCFTQFNVDFDYQRLGNVSYLIVGAEICPTTGKRHHQGYVEYTNAISWANLNKRIPETHTEPAEGNAASNTKYCSKDNNLVIECGSPKQQGRRTDLEGIIRNIIEDPETNTKDLVECNPGTWARNYRALEKVKDLYEPKRSWETQVYYIWGPTGCGKSRFCHDLGATKVYFDGTFFRDYGGEDDVYFDEVVPGQWRKELFLDLCDSWYPCSINVKGGSRNWKPRRIFFTSNYPPEETLIFDGFSVLRPEVSRRITKVIDCTSGPIVL